MRSSKSRSRSKSNRNRSSVGNVVNRVFDSSGPDGKVRGTPQQIIDKYNQLARDAQLANDRVATENFQQHAEHYMRLLSEAQREQEQRREQQERENRERQAQRDRERGDNNQSSDDAQPQTDEQPSADQGKENAQRQNNRRNNRNKPAIDQDVLDLSDDDDSNLVETPESAAEAEPEPKPKAKRKPRKKPEPKETDASDAPVADAAD
jgi:hypothetical protein